MTAEMNLSIKEIAEACSGTLFLKKEEGDKRVTSLELDSRKVIKGGVFLATVGERADGHKFITEVFQKGAILAITEKTPVQVEQEHGQTECAKHWGNYILVKDSFQALKDIAEYYRKKFNIPIVGITGSVGKTSTKEFIAAVLCEKYNVLKTEGNFNNEVGVPLTLLRLRKEHEAAVIEMGISDFGEMRRLSKMVRPTICVITNIGQCHLENLKTKDGVLRAKTEIFEYMQENGEVCLNGDDEKLSTITKVKEKAVHFFGIKEDNKKEIFTKEIKSHGLWGSEVFIYRREKQDQFLLSIPTAGVHMITNAAAAVCVGTILGLTKEQMTHGIAKVASLNGRNHFVKLKNITLIDDCYNANPVSMEASIDLLSLADTAKTAILGDMFELGTDCDEMHEKVGQYVAQKGINTIFCIGEHAKHMYKAALQNTLPNQQIFYFPTKEAFLDAFKQQKEKWFFQENTILIKASHGMHFEELVVFLQKEFA